MVDQNLCYFDNLKKFILVLQYACNAMQIVRICQFGKFCHISYVILRFQDISKIFEQ